MLAGWMHAASEPRAARHPASSSVPSVAAAGCCTTARRVELTAGQPAKLLTGYPWQRHTLPPPSFQQRCAQPPARCGLYAVERACRTTCHCSLPRCCCKKETAAICMCSAVAVDMRGAAPCGLCVSSCCYMHAVQADVSCRVSKLPHLQEPGLLVLHSCECCTHLPPGH